MEWLQRMHGAIKYIEEHLEESYNAEEIAQVAYSSSYHFQRIFHMLTGISLAEYVRKRKLTIAAQELAATKGKVLDIALKYGYDTPESFSKAFRIGKSKRFTTKDGENYKKIPEFWSESCRNGFRDELIELSEDNNILGVCMNDFEGEEFSYMIAAEVSEGISKQGMILTDIPKATWAVFESIGSMPGAIQKVWDRIFSEWFPATNFEHADAPELEVYPDGDTNSEDYRCEIWIPIIKK